VPVMDKLLRKKSPVEGRGYSCFCCASAGKTGYGMAKRLNCLSRYSETLSNKPRRICTRLWFPT
jgi:hypothetical protein